MENLKDYSRNIGSDIFLVKIVILVDQSNVWIGDVPSAQKELQLNCYLSY